MLLQIEEFSCNERDIIEKNLHLSFLLRWSFGMFIAEQIAYGAWDIEWKGRMVEEASGWFFYNFFFLLTLILILVVSCLKNN